MRRDEEYMAIALRAAAEAGRAGDVPIGAVVVHEDEVVAVAGNRREQDQDPTAHAEILALRQAGRRLSSWRLNDCVLYITLQPCPQRLGACINARIGRLVFACRDPKSGAASSHFQPASDDRLNHRFVVTEGVRRQEASRMLSEFFANLRGGENGTGQRTISS